MPDDDYKLTTWNDQTTHYVPLSAAEFQGVRVAKANLLEALFIEEQMDIVIENYLELENEILASSVRRMVPPDSSYLSAQSQRNLFSRRIVNLLTACKGYLDQTRHHISNIWQLRRSVVRLNLRLIEKFGSCGFAWSHGCARHPLDHRASICSRNMRCTSSIASGCLSVE